ncbi:protein S40-1-like [Prosopis cineraria]|uniref:protein S40-1-like n=1 Tax=Prosopis cineraria TaxID=364024 RepID=UPI00240FC8C1|nr:protein S40-1-like [Prosopis cineraria]
MAEEFQEADVIFSDRYCMNPHRTASSDGEDDDRIGISQTELDSRRSKLKRSKKKKKEKKKEMANSMPVNIPERIFRRTDSDDQLEEEWKDEGMVPPYVIVNRRIARKMAFSVCTGNGRTLKGRDLSQVRNSILRMTGFLEA